MCYGLKETMCNGSQQSRGGEIAEFRKEVYVILLMEGVTHNQKGGSGISCWGEVNKCILAAGEWEHL